MRNLFLAIFICVLAFGVAPTVYAYPSFGDDCASCHGGGGNTQPDPADTPGCGSSSGCDRRLLAENQTIGASEPVIGSFATDVTEEDGFTISHPAHMRSRHQVIVLDEGSEERTRKFASWGVVVVTPEEGQNAGECAKFVEDINADPDSEFYNKIDVDSLIDFTK